MRGGENYTSGIATADRGPLHLEARVNYESIGARSAFIGWNFSGGDTITWELTPLLGGAWGTTQAFVPGLEATLGWKTFDFYVEAEIVRSRREQTDSYVYAWSELGWRPVEWLRVGLAGQRNHFVPGRHGVGRLGKDDADILVGDFGPEPREHRHAFVRKALQVAIEAGFFFGERRQGVDLAGDEQRFFPFQQGDETLQPETLFLDELGKAGWEAGIDSHSVATPGRFAPTTSDARCR